MFMGDHQTVPFPRVGWDGHGRATHSPTILHGAVRQVGYRVSETLYVGIAPTRPLSLNKCNGSEVSNEAAISPFRYITWPTSVSMHDKTLKGSKIHRCNDMRDLLKPRFVHHLQ